MSSSQAQGGVRIKEIRLGPDLRMTVQRFPDGYVTLILGSPHLGIDLALSSDDAAELVAALAPDVADLREALSLLTDAADETLPRSLIDGPEVCAEARNLRDAVRHSRAVLAEGRA